jgi:hypothetical protein
MVERIYELLPINTNFVTVKRRQKDKAIKIQENRSISGGRGIRALNDLQHRAKCPDTSRGSSRHEDPEAHD